MALHFSAGGSLYSALKVSGVEVGAILAVLIVAIGYYCSKILVISITKRISKKISRIIIGIGLAFIYIIFSHGIAVLSRQSGMENLPQGAKLVPSPEEEGTAPIFKLPPGATLVHGPEEETPAQNQVGNRPEQALKLTVRDGDYNDLQRELRNKKWSADELGMGLLTAAGLNKPREAALLLRNGANPDYSVLGRNGVAVAASEDNPEVLEVLLKHGADPNWKAMFDWRPLHFAIKKNNSHDRVLLLLLQYGATVDATTDLLITPLHRAAGFCSGSAVQILLQHGASKKLRDKYGQTAAQRAEKSSCNEITSLLNPS